MVCVHSNDLYYRPYVVALCDLATNVHMTYLEFLAAISAIHIRTSEILTVMELLHCILVIMTKMTWFLKSSKCYLRSRVRILLRTCGTSINAFIAFVERKCTYFRHI